MPSGMPMARPSKSLNYFNPIFIEYDFPSSISIFSRHVPGDNPPVERLKIY